jgi:hypothetical protein
MVQYFTDDGILMDYGDFIQFLEYKMNFELWDNVECMRIYLDGFDEYSIDVENWRTQKQLLIEAYSIV